MHTKLWYRHSFLLFLRLSLLVLKHTLPVCTSPGALAFSASMDTSRGVRHPDLQDGDMGWLREATVTALGTDASDGGAFNGVPASFLAVFITEIGDKTFFLAMLLAVRHGRLAVFVATLSAMFFMTLGSTFAGYLVSTSTAKLEDSITVMDIVASVMFGAFAVSLLRDAWKLHVKDRNDGEVRALLGGEKDTHDTTHGELLDAEATLDKAEQKDGEVKTWWGGVYQTFCLMFVAEWGDKSMFATMALATHNAPLGVVLGAMGAHATANAIAVIGGGMLGKAISEKYMALCGGIVFLAFACATAYEGITRNDVPFL